METPDKIYLEKEKEINKISHLWGVSPVVHSGYEHIEYIRKDTLLEWAKAKEDYALTMIVKLAYKTMIEKIESM